MKKLKIFTCHKEAHLSQEEIDRAMQEGLRFAREVKRDLAKMTSENVLKCAQEAARETVQP